MSVTQYVPFQAGPRLIDGSQLNAMFNQLYKWPGNIFYCNPAATKNGDGLINTPFNSLVTAYGACVSGNNDIVVLVGNGSTTATARLTSTLTWAKNATHLVGVTAPSLFSSRARIAPLTTATTNINPLMNITGSGCIFYNFSMFQGIGQASTDEQLIDIAGSRNVFQNVDFGGMGHANGAARAGSYIIGLNGGGENLFQSCAIGLETVARSAANASVKIKAASQRNDFIDCVFDMYPTANTPLVLDANLSNGLNGSTMMFKRCTHRALLGAASGTQPAVWGTIHASVNGTVHIDASTTMAAHWGLAANGNLYINAPNNTSGKMGFTGGVFVVTADS